MKQKLIIALIFIAQIGFSQITEINPTSIRYLELSEEGEKEFEKNQKLG